MLTLNNIFVLSDVKQHLSKYDSIFRIKERKVRGSIMFISLLKKVECDIF